MPLHRVVILWCLATVMSCLAAATSADATPSVPDAHATVSLVAGPWLLVGEDGAIRCGVEVTGTIDPAQVRLEQGGRVVDVPPAIRPFQVANRPAAAVVEIVLPRGATGDWSLTIPGRRIAFRPTAIPAVNAAARVAFASASNWPRPQDLAALAERLGGPIDLVVAYGLHAAAQMGSAGWEADVPIVVLPERLPHGMRLVDQVETIAAARLGMLAVQWAGGTRWGCLGLPWTSSPTTAARVIARDLSPWEVCLVPSAWWELGLLAPRLTRNATSTAPLISLCQHMHVPLILTLGGGAGWVSEPLQVDQDVLRVAPGGTRVIAATPAGDGLALLPATVAEVIDAPGVIAIAADQERLRVVGVGFAGTDLLALEIARDAAGFTGDGVGQVPMADDDVVTLRTQIVQNDEVGAKARARCRWMTARTLGTLHLEGPDVLALLGLSGETEAPGTTTLLRHLTRVDEVAGTALAEHQARLPTPVLRDLMLRQIALRGAFDAAVWTPVIATTDDRLFLSAILRANQDGIDAAMLDLLTARVKAQADGTTPLESDELLQHRLMTAVFDSTSLSPTGLRPLAVALQPKLSPFTVGPVERFIARHGTVRK